MLRRKSRWWLATAVGALAVVLGASIAMAAELADGDYVLTVPGVGDFEFSVASASEGETVEAVAAPDGYEVDDDDPDKAAWKNTMSLEVREVEAKTGKIEGDYYWTGGDATLTLPDGAVITITEPDGDGDFTVSVDSENWHALGGGSDWYVATDDDLSDGADQIFKVEADEDGIEIIAVDADEVEDGFINDLNDDAEDQAEIAEEAQEADEEEPEDEDEDEEDDNGPPENPGRP